MCTSEAQKKVAKKQGISPFFSLKTFRVTKHLMSGARATGSLPLHFSRSLVFHALRFVLFYLFVLSFFVEEVMENGIAWKKRERGMIHEIFRRKGTTPWVLGVVCFSPRYFYVMMIYDFLCKLLNTLMIKYS